MPKEVTAEILRLQSSTVTSTSVASAEHAEQPAKQSRKQSGKNDVDDSTGTITTTVATASTVAAVTTTTTVAGVEWLKRNAERKGVTVLPSGLQYKVVKTGSGIKISSESVKCYCHYEGSLIDGTVFDSSIARGTPALFAPNQVSPHHVVFLPLILYW